MKEKSAVTSPRAVGGPSPSATIPFNDQGVCLAKDAFLSGATQGVNDTLDLASGNCTANDIRIAHADIISYSFDGTTFIPFNPGDVVNCQEGSPIFITTSAHVKETATSERTDVGIWIAQDGGNARTGLCNHYNLVNGVTGVSNIDGDQCGDMNNAAEAIVPLGVIDATCATSPTSGDSLHIGSCLGWTQPGGDQVCPQNNSNTPNGFRWGTVPGTTSKCNCEGFNIPIVVNKTAKIEVVKSCVPTTDGGTFDLKIDGSTSDGNPPVDFGNDKACGTNTGLRTVSAGTNVSPGADHTVAEDGFSIAASNYTSTVSCTKNGAAYIASQAYTTPNTLTVHTDPNDQVICTFVNTRKPTITLVKRIVNNNGGTAVVGDFGITTTAGSLTFGAGAADGANTLKYTSNTILLNAGGTFTLHENDVAGYTEGTWACTGVAGTVNSNFNTGSVVVAAGEQAVCTITNDDQGSTLQLVKRIVNDNGGTKVVGDFGITTTAGALTFGAGAADGANTLKYTATAIGVSAGSYTLHESDVGGYTEGTWSCTGAAGAVNNNFNTGSVVVGLGETVVCTITNDDQPASLTIVKRIVNDNGGTKVVGDFGITTTAGSLTFGAGVADGANTLKYTATTLTGLSAGSKTLHESDVAGYVEGSWSCTGNAGAVNTDFNTGSVVLGNGESVTCTITNDDSPASLQLVKRIVNDNGGTKVVGDFGITTTAGALTFGAGAADGANTLKYTAGALAVSAGTYTLHESDVGGYTEGTWSCTGAAGAVNNNFNTGSVVVANGETVVCTITNDDQPASLTIVKRIVNDNGGTKVVGDFGITTTAGALTFGAGAADGANTLKYTATTLTGLSAGSKTLHESDVAGYVEGSWSCTGNAGAVNTNFNTGSVVLGNGESVTCTITNDDSPASLQLVKRIVNDNGGTKVVGDFGITTTAGALTFGAGAADGANTLKYTAGALAVNAGTYTLHESDVTGYTEGTWSCTGAAGAVNNNFNTGSVVVANGETVVCTITNDDQPATLTIVKRIVNNNGGTKVVGDFGITTTAGSLTFGAGAADGANTLKYTATTLTGLSAGSKTLHENDVTGYTEGSWSCTGNAGAVNTNFNTGSVVLGNGEAVTCTITNDDQPATLTIVKIVKGPGTTFSYSTSTSSATPLPAGFTLTPATDGSDQIVFSNLNAATYNVTETVPPNYTLTDLACTGDFTATYDPTITQTVVPVLPNGGSVTCTFTNEGVVSQTTRTQGFWATHSGLTFAVWFGGTSGGHTFPGIADKTLCGRPIDTLGKLLGGFWSSISFTTTKVKRSDLDQARMQLLQQLLAAILNNAAFGSSPTGSISIAQAKAAYCGTDIQAIKDAQAAMAAFNTSGDNGVFTPGASANGKVAKDLANLVFWDVLP